MANPALFIIPFASTLDEPCQTVIKTLVLPQLTRMLKHAELVHTDRGDEFDFIPPHERALGTNEVVVTPCHWSVGIDHIRMDNPDDLQLTEEESRVLFAVVAPYFAGDGITLSYDTPLRWLVKQPIDGEVLSNVALQGISFASLDRVIGRNVDVWQPQSEASKAFRRLQNEMQMLLYTHPINDAREAQGLPTVNSFWMSRAATAPKHTPEPASAAKGVIVDASLREFALCGDWPAWALAWQAISTKLCEASALASQSGCGLQLTLCGERHASTFELHPKRDFSQRLRHLLVRQLLSRQPTLHQVLASL